MLLFIIIVLDIICLDILLMAGVFVIYYSQLPRKPSYSELICRIKIVYAKAGTVKYN